MYRIGIGYDIHRLKKGRRLFLGGVEFINEKGLDGHSDADVLLHAIMDALLGAAGLEDIGRHFPNTDPRYKDISSLKLLGKVGKLLKKKNFAIINLDSTLIAEAPKISKYLVRMKENISKELGLPAGSIGIKATSNERIGAVGRKEGIAAVAVGLVKNKK